VLSERPLGVDGGRYRVLALPEASEELVRPALDDLTAGALDGGAHDAPVFCQQASVVVPEPMDEPRRVLDVGEEERHGSAKQLRYHSHYDRR
jgi:hypothetical protein